MGPVKTSCLGCLITLAHCFRKHDFEVAAVVLLAQVLIKKISCCVWFGFKSLLKMFFFVNAGVWLRMKNKFFRKYFQLTVCFNGFNPEISFSQNFHFKPFLDSRAKRESPAHAFGFADESRARIMPSTSSIYEPTNRSST